MRNRCLLVSFKAIASINAPCPSDSCPESGKTVAMTSGNRSYMAHRSYCNKHSFRRRGEEPSMPQHIGIVAGSAEGAALCYRTICLEAQPFLGEHDHPEITMNSVPLATHLRYILASDWEWLAEVLLDSTRKLAEAGADFAICPDNTYHQEIGRASCRERV